MCVGSPASEPNKALKSLFILKAREGMRIENRFGFLPSMIAKQSFSYKKQRHKTLFGRGAQSPPAK